MKETCRESFRANCHRSRSVKAAVQSAYDFADFSVLCQVGRFAFAFCYQFLMIFLYFRIFPFDRTSFFTFIIPGSRYRAGLANCSNRRTKVSLHCTGRHVNSSAFGGSLPLLGASSAYRFAIQIFRFLSNLPLSNHRVLFTPSDWGLVTVCHHYKVMTAIQEIVKTCVMQSTVQ